MKSIYKLSALLVLFILAGCSTDLDLLDSPNGVSPENAETDLFYNKIVLDFGSFYSRTSTSVMPVVRMRAMTGGNQYNNNYSPADFDGIWSKAYQGLLPDMEALSLNAEKGNNRIHLGSVQVMKAYVLMTLTDMFGAVPYTEALQGFVNPSPAADTDESVYASALALLNEAITNLGAETTGVPANDLFYGGDASKWIKLANTLKLKYYLTGNAGISDAKAQINAILTAGDYIQEAADNFVFPYGVSRANPDSRHPFFTSQYETNDGGYMSNHFMSKMREGRAVVDPRLRYYFYRQDLTTEDENQFTLACVSNFPPTHYSDDMPWCLATRVRLASGLPDGAAAQGYWGRDHGDDDGIPPDGSKRTVWGLYPAGGKFDADESTDVKNSGADGAKGEGISPIMMSFFVDFMKADAALELGTDGDPRASLEAGVRGSIETVMGFESRTTVNPDFKPSSDDVEAYVEAVLAEFDAAADDEAKLNIIMEEYHTALFGNGIEAYNNYRRTGMPFGMQFTREADAGDFPRLMFYPSKYVNLNANATQKSITEQIFWDKNPADFIK